MEKRRIAILGSTGSIGRQALDVISQHRDLFEVELLTANNSSDLLIRQAIEFNANAVVICNESKYAEVSEALEPHYIKVFAGMKSVCDLVSGDNIDIVLTSMVGFSGLESTISAVKAGKTIALANKETLVAGGSVIMDLVKRTGRKLLPIDSEHSAIFQCLEGEKTEHAEKIKTALEFMEKNYGEEIAIADVAAACYFSQYHFMRFFKKYMGMSCGEYLKNLRLEKAAQAFARGNTVILDVAMDAGFRNLSYFYREFQKKYGYTPKQFIHRCVEMPGK